MLFCSRAKPAIKVLILARRKGAFSSKQLFRQFADAAIESKK
jgi:hypothetical protein